MQQLTVILSYNIYGIYYNSQLIFNHQMQQSPCPVTAPNIPTSAKYVDANALIKEP